MKFYITNGLQRTLNKIKDVKLVEQKDFIEKLKKDWETLFYPDAKKWMWDYSYFLGKFTDTNGINWDLGLHINKFFCITHIDRFVEANVYNNIDGCYKSGVFNTCEWDMEERKKECLKRAVLLGIIPDLFLEANNLDKNIFIK